jgi:hypothetical protein
MKFAVCAILLGASVQSAEVCRSVVDGRCEGASREFPSDVGSVVFVTTLHGLPAGTMIWHVWRRAGKRVSSVRLRVDAALCTVQSTVVVGPGQSGNWTVEVLAPGRKQLKRVDFKVLEPVPKTGKGKREPKPVPYQPPQQEP